MNQSKQTTDGALLLAIFVILMLATMFVPIISLPLFFLLPTPFIMYASKYDWKPSLVMFGAAIILSLLFIPALSLPLSVYSGIGGIMIGIAIHQNLSAYETWARGTLGYVFGLLFIYIFTQFFLDINWGQEFDLMLNESMEMSIELLNKFGFDSQQTSEVQKLIEDSLLGIKKLTPVILVVVALIIGLITQWIGYKIMNRLERKEYYFPPFRKFKLPIGVVGFYIVAFLITLFDSNPDSLLYVGATNVQSLVGLLLVIQGFSLMFFYAHHKKWSKGLPITGVVLTLLFPLLFFYVVQILGIIDIGFGIRKKMTKNKK